MTKIQVRVVAPFTTENGMRMAVEASEEANIPPRMAEQLRDGADPATLDVALAQFIDQLRNKVVAAIPAGSKKGSVTMAWSVSFN